jgi:hypothetical protein
MVWTLLTQKSIFYYNLLILGDIHFILKRKINFGSDANFQMNMRGLKLFAMKRLPVLLEVLLVFVLAVLLTVLVRPLHVSHSSERAATRRVAGAVVFGDCIFRVDPSGLLTRNGSCPTQSGNLSLSAMSIKAFAPDVFSNMPSAR